MPDGTLARAERIARVLEIQGQGRVGAGERGEAWISLMLREQGGPEPVTQDALDSEEDTLGPISAAVPAAEARGPEEASNASPKHGGTGGEPGVEQTQVAEEGSPLEFHEAATSALATAVGDLCEPADLPKPDAASIADLDAANHAPDIANQVPDIQEAPGDVLHDTIPAGGPDATDRFDLDLDSLDSMGGSPLDLDLDLELDFATETSDVTSQLLTDEMDRHASPAVGDGVPDGHSAAGDDPAVEREPGGQNAVGVELPGSAFPGAIEPPAAQDLGQGPGRKQPAEQSLLATEALPAAEAVPTEEALDVGVPIVPGHDADTSDEDRASLVSQSPQLLAGSPIHEDAGPSLSIEIE
ncbi:MAG: hypothetical protein AAF637_22655, partial [Pseudomonadota bacterium]